MKNGHIHVPVTVLAYSEDGQQVRHPDDVLNLAQRDGTIKDLKHLTVQNRSNNVLHRAKVQTHVRQI